MFQSWMASVVKINIPRWGKISASQVFFFLIEFHKPNPAADGIFKLENSPLYASLKSLLKADFKKNVLLKNTGLIPEEFQRVHFYLY